MSKTIEMLKSYVPYNEQEKEDVKLIIEAEEIFGDILTRENKFCHLTSSAFVINKTSKTTNRTPTPTSSGIPSA